MFIAFIYAFVMQFPVDISRGPFATVVLFIDEFVGDILEYEWPDMMIIRICNVLIVELYH